LIVHNIYIFKLVTRFKRQMSFDYLLFILTIKRSKNNGRLKVVGITLELGLTG